MMNNFIATGTIKKVSKPKDDIIILVIESCFTENTDTEKTLLKIIVPETLIKRAEKYLKVGAFIGIRGQIKYENNENKIITSKMTFLASSKEKDEDIA